MNSLFTCPLCDLTFKQKVGLKIHLNRKKPCTDMTKENQEIVDKFSKSNHITIGERYPCLKCGSEYTRSSSLKTHLIKCKGGKTTLKEDTQINLGSMEVLNGSSLTDILKRLINDMSETRNSVSKTEFLVSETRKELSSIREETQKAKPNNLLVHIGNNEDFYDKLEQILGNEQETLTYIIDCALSDKNGSGSGKLVRKIYDMGLKSTITNPDQPQPIPAFGWYDSKGTVVKFRNERGEWSIESRDAFGERLSTYLQECYTKTFQKMEEYKDTHGQYPCEWNTYQLNTWNEMNAKRADPKFRKKLIRDLDLPKLNHVPTVYTQFQSRLKHRAPRKPKVTAIIEEAEEDEYEPDHEVVEPLIITPEDMKRELELLKERDLSWLNSRIQVAPPSDFIPGAPPVLHPIKYVSPNTISIKDLIRKPSSKPVQCGNDT